MAYVLMDVGGTQIKAQTYLNSAFSGEISVYNAKSGGGKEEIFRNFAEIIRTQLAALPAGEQSLSGVGMAFPGPFDYRNGVSLMQGLGKYDAIYGCSIPQEIKALLPQLTGDVPFVFLHDVEAFAIGEVRFGAAANSRRAIHLCIGTGAGSAFTENGIVLKKAAKGVPENGWIYNTPFRGSIIDDYVSVRGLASISGRYFENAPDGAALATLCEKGDFRAENVFAEFGKDVCDALAPFLKEFQPDTLVLGGQISKSFGRFGAELTELCRAQNIKIEVCPNTSQSIVKGLLSVLAQSESSMPK